jgi:hypothetical protein
VTQDYDGFDTGSNLNRPGVFRLNIAVGRDRFEELLGYGRPLTPSTTLKRGFRRGRPRGLP